MLFRLKRSSFRVRSFNIFPDITLRLSLDASNRLKLLRRQFGLMSDPGAAAAAAASANDDDTSESEDDETDSPSSEEDDEDEEEELRFCMCVRVDEQCGLNLWFCFLQ